MGLKLRSGGAAVELPSQAKRRDIALAVARIVVGGYWLYEQHWKLPPDFGLRQPRGLMFAFQQGIQYPTLGIYKTFLQTIVVPNFYLFGWLLLLLEVCIGMSLLLGLLTRAGALLGTLQAVNLLIGAASTPEGPWIYIALVAANLLLLFTPCNRKYSLDRLLAPRLDTAAEPGSLIGRSLRWLM